MTTDRCKCGRALETWMERATSECRVCRARRLASARRANRDKWGPPANQTITEVEIGDIEIEPSPMDAHAWVARREGAE